MSTEKFDNNDFVNEGRSYAITRPLQLAIRDFHATASSLRFWAGLAAVVLVLAVAAPFNTGSHFTFPTLLMYWGAIAVGTFFIAMAISGSASNWFRQLGLPALPGNLAGGLISSMPVTLFVVVFNRLFFDIDPIADHGLGRFYVQCMLITMAMFTIFRIVESASDDSTGHDYGSTSGNLPTGHDDPAGSVDVTAMPILSSSLPRTALHQRLPSDLGDDIVSLQAQDHYIDVTTTAGHEMILLRLGDAVRELQGLPGMQVHRSWWVAEAHLSAVKRDGSRLMALLDTGAEVPVSRARVSALRTMLALRGHGGD